MMKFFIILLVLVTGFLGWTLFNPQKNKISSLPIVPTGSEKVEEIQEITTSEIPQQTTIVEGLDTPWAIAFLPDQGMLVTERPGRVRLVDKNGKLRVSPVATLEKVKEIGEGGLLGIALHPDFSSNGFVYLYYTYSGEENDTFNRVVRMIYKDGKLIDEKIIVDKIPGNSNHNGGRITFGPDKFLYITTGDAQNSSQAQDRYSLAGKILRVTDDGKPASNNPFNNLVYSFGHRNPQGLAWDSLGRLWSTEHGRSGIQSGLDELNLIESGKNYGWPTIQGDQTQVGMITPIIHSGPNATWAPAGAAFIGNSVFFGGLRGQTLYEAVLEGEKVTLKEHFKGEFGRIREVIKGQDGMLYITTSNQDGRGIPNLGDDKIIKVNPNKL